MCVQCPSVVKKNEKKKIHQMVKIFVNVEAETKQKDPKRRSSGCSAYVRGTQYYPVVVTHSKHSHTWKRVCTTIQNIVFIFWPSLYLLIKQRTKFFDFFFVSLLHFLRFSQIFTEFNFLFFAFWFIFTIPIVYCFVILFP